MYQQLHKHNRAAAPDMGKAVRNEDRRWQCGRRGNQQKQGRAKAGHMPTTSMCVLVNPEGSEP